MQNFNELKLFAFFPAQDCTTQGCSCCQARVPNHFERENGEWLLGGMRKRNMDGENGTGKYD
jgi:hypothetical protein